MATTTSMSQFLWIMVVMIFCSVTWVDAFHLVGPSYRLHSASLNPVSQSTYILLKSSNGDGDDASSSAAPSSMRKRTRKRKDVVTSDETQEAAAATSKTPTLNLKPRDDTPIQMEIMDVRDIVGIGSSGSPSSSSKQVAPSRGFDNDGDEEDDDEEDQDSRVGFTSSSSTDDSLRQLLEDAKMMQEEEGVSGTSGGDAGQDDSVKAKIRNALSTLVTADFFVVCAFLLWFLVGIFCSSILKDDTIQIAFNSKLSRKHGGGEADWYICH